MWQETVMSTLHAHLTLTITGLLGSYYLSCTFIVTGFPNVDAHIGASLTSMDTFQI